MFCITLMMNSVEEGWRKLVISAEGKNKQIMNYTIVFQ